MKLLTGNSNKILSQKISKYLKTRLVNSNIKKFSENLLDNLDTLDKWPNKVKIMQKNWESI